MESLVATLSALSRHVASAGANLAWTAAIGAAAACTGPEASLRREPARLVVEPATFDDEDARTPPSARPTPTRPVEDPAPQLTADRVAPAQPVVVQQTAGPRVAPPSVTFELPSHTPGPLPPAALPKRPTALSASGRERCETVRPTAERLADGYGMDLALIMAVARVESDYDPGARNRSTGATGLMQVMPSTGDHFKCGDLEDADDNLECGVRVLKRYIEYFDGDLNYAVAAYHAGPKWSKQARSDGLLPKNYSYIEKVMQLRTRFKRRGCE